MDELTIKPECPVHGTPLVPEHLRDNMQAQGRKINIWGS